MCGSDVYRMIALDDRITIFLAVCLFKLVQICITSSSQSTSSYNIDELLSSWLDWIRETECD